MTDALGSTRGLVDGDENLTDSYTYTPYGTITEHNGTSENNFLFTGEQRDSETDDYYLRARYYSPSSGRFISRDSYDGTLYSPLSQNHYAYTHGNPTNYTDPSGNIPTQITLTMNMLVMQELRVKNPIAHTILHEMINEASCVVVEHGIDMAIREGIYMWITNDGKVYVGKSNDDIEKRMKDHLGKKVKIFNKQLARINLSIPAQLLETIEEVIMEELGYVDSKNKGQSTNSRHNFSLKKPKRREAYRRYKKLLDKLCK